MTGCGLDRSPPEDGGDLSVSGQGSKGAFFFRFRWLKIPSHYHKSLTYDGQKKLAELILVSVRAFGIRFANSKLYTNDNKANKKERKPFGSLSPLRA